MQINTESLISFLICIACYFLRTLYEVLKYKGRISPANKIIFRMMFVNMCLLRMSWFIMCETDTEKLKIPVQYRIAGLIVFAAGIFLFIFFLYRLRALDDYREELVRNGLFSVIRYPMYIGFIFWIIGYSVF